GGPDPVRVNGAPTLPRGAQAPPTAPVDVTRPQIYGRPQEGATLSASTGIWEDAGSFTYRWRRCNAAGGNCISISGAAAAGYTLTPADVGRSIGVQVSARNRYGSATAGSVADARAFDGASAYVRVPDIAGLHPESSNAFTVGFWLRLDSSSNNVLPRIWEKGPDYMAVMGDPANRLFRHVAIEVQNASGSGNANRGASEFWGSTALRTGVWYDIVAVFDRS